MRINGYRCDGCDKEHLLSADRMLHYYGEALPSDWFVVGRGQEFYQHPPEPQIFCSRGCLHTWLTSQITADDIEVPA